MPSPPGGERRGRAWGGAGQSGWVATNLQEHTLQEHTRQPALTHSLVSLPLGCCGLRINRRSLDQPPLRCPPARAGGLWPQCCRLMQSHRIPAQKKQQMQPGCSLSPRQGTPRAVSSSLLATVALAWPPSWASSSSSADEELSLGGLRPHSGAGACARLPG